MLFDTVLIANRGEISRRIGRTLRALGIRSIAVASDIDAAAPHAREADDVIVLGAASAYLDVDAIVGAALRSGADAIHPGYGFLSESTALASACHAHGIAFIGPEPHALDIMGDKIRAKTQVSQYGVPIVPGFSARGLSDDDIAARADATGYPLLVKPSAGGGGKGMQIVRARDELAAALASARRVARGSFGDDALLLERLVERPRHIEVQILADAHGSVVHIGERECTLQRRHQKVIEEAPSPAVGPDLRARLGAAAVDAARSVGYRGAGTVEFLVSAHDPDTFFFIEMNTRLQVEHPVTEAISGLDLVEQQLRIAAGEPLGFTQEDVHLTGHAVEARVYAETPERGFLPATGTIGRWRTATGVRTDSAVEEGSVITPDYDPMIAKVIAHGPDRESALARLTTALRDTVVLGVDTNIGFLVDLLEDPDVRAGNLDTGLIGRRDAPVWPAPTATAIAAADAALAPNPHGGVFGALDGWRWGGVRKRPVPLWLAADETVVSGGEAVAADTSRALSYLADDGAVWVHTGDGTVRLRPTSRRAETLRGIADRGSSARTASAAAPMPGTVVAVHVADGDPVDAGQPLVTIEAMKMEHAVSAPHDGIVTLRVALGDHVRKDQDVADVNTENGSNEQ